MSIDELKSDAKKYWPYLVGGLIGLYILYRYSGFGSNSTVTSTGESPAQIAAEGQAGAQLTGAQAQLVAAQGQASAAGTNANATLDAAQGTAIGQIITADSLTALQAMQSGTADTETALNNAAAAQIANDQAASQSSQAFYGAVGTVGQAAANAIQGVAQSNAAANASTANNFIKTSGDVLEHYGY